MKNPALRYIIIGVIVALLAACNSIHDTPGEDATDPTLVHTFITLLPGADMKPFTSPEQMSRLQNETFLVRYIVEVYTDESFNAGLLFRREILRPAGDTAAVIVSFDLHALHYRVAVWRDYVPAATSADYFYDTGNLASVKIKGTHMGCTDYKDVFSGLQLLDLTAYRNNWNSIHRVEMQLERPLAKVELITTDVVKYLDKLRNVNRSEVLDGLKVKVDYTGYFPVGFNMFLDRPNEVLTGVSFNSSLVPLSEQEALLAFDYVFVNGTESAIDIEMTIYNATGAEVNKVTGVHVPIRRNRVTTLRDEFLTRDYAPGIGIHPGFDGEINIVVP